MITMEKTRTVLALVTALVLITSGCMGSADGTSDEPNSSENGPEEVSAQEWCSSNNHGDAVASGCTTEQETLSAGGILYEADAHCPESGQGYACSK